MRKVKQLCYLVGAYKIGEGLYTVNKSIYDYNFASHHDLKERYNGGYAIVTGATDGLGKIYAINLAKKGFNLVLVSRNNEKLEKVKKEIQQMYNIDVQNITFDFKNSDVESYNKIFETTSKLDISLLVNNVGANLGIRDFEKNSYDDIKDISVVNMLPVTLLSKHFAKRFLERNQKSGIINVGSIAGELPIFLNPDYSSTKAYVNEFTRNLNKELKNSNIDVQLLYPGRMETSMTKNAPKTYLVKLLTAPAEKVIQNSIDLLGVESETLGHTKFDMILYLNKQFGSLADLGLFINNLYSKHLMGR